MPIEACAPVIINSHKSNNWIPSVIHPTLWMPMLERTRDERFKEDNLFAAYIHVEPIWKVL